MSSIYYLLLDLKNDPELIATYEAHHQRVWPEIEQSLRDSGIMKCEIFRFTNRLMMRLEVNEHFDFESKKEKDAHSPVVQEWEMLMWKFQQALPETPQGSKWQLMNKIYDWQS
jgi:L-rhamnose mutarotase